VVEAPAQPAKIAALAIALARGLAASPVERVADLEQRQHPPKNLPQRGSPSSAQHAAL
jgi:hypothetical protein